MEGDRFSRVGEIKAVPVAFSGYRANRGGGVFLSTTRRALLPSWTCKLHFWRLGSLYLQTSWRSMKSAGIQKFNIQLFSLKDSGCYTANCDK